jgi:hypothetical protein
MNEFLEDSIIPETAIEVLKSNVTSRDITLYSASMRGDLEYLDEFIGRVVAKFTREAVTEVIDTMVHGYIKKKHTSNPLPVVTDPSEMICLDLIKSSVQKEANEIAHTAVAFLIDEYIVESQYITYFRRVMVGKFVSEVLKEAVDESIIENMIDLIINGILDGFVEPLVLLTAEEEYFEQEGEEIEKAFEEFERREILQV